MLGYALIIALGCVLVVLITIAGVMIREAFALADAADDTWQQRAHGDHPAVPLISPRFHDGIYAEEGQRNHG